MSDFSNFLEAAAYNHLLRGVAYVPTGVWYAQLHDGVPGDDGLNNAFGARSQVTSWLPSAALRQVVSGDKVFFPASPNTASFVSIWDAVAAGNCLAIGALAAPVQMGFGGRFDQGELTISFTQLLPVPLADVGEYAANGFLGLAFRNVAFAPPAGHLIHAYNTNPNPDDSGAEVAGTGYAAKAVTWAAPADGQGQSSIDVEIGPNTSDPAANWTEGNYLACKDNTGGLIVYGSVTAFTLAQGEAQFWEAGALACQVA